MKQPVENPDVPNTERSLKGGDIGQRPAVPRISSNSKCEDESSTQSGPSSPSTNYSLPKSSGVQSKASNYGVGAEDPSISLEEMLGYFFEPEILEGSNQYHCEQCQSLQDAERSVVISKAPSFLVLTLKRFSYNVATHQRSKILQSVTYPLKLKLSNNIIRIKDDAANNDLRVQTEGGSTLLEERQTSLVGQCYNDEKEKLEAPPSKYTKKDVDYRAPHSSQMSADGNSSSITLDNFPSETMYALTSIVVHSGVSSESGHYYCYARPSSHVIQQDDNTIVESKGKTNGGEGSKKPPQMVTTDNHSWCLFNDSRVSFARYETFSDITKRFPKDTPYVLIYKNISKYSTHGASEASVSMADDTKENKISQDLLDAVNLDNLLYLQVSDCYV
jgi:ubiquitin carboxyl-terminal hydrolase 35/38